MDQVGVLDLVAVGQQVLKQHAALVVALELRFLVLNNRLDWPVVQILVDGREPFTDQLPGWQGLIVGSESAL